MLRKLIAVLLLTAMLTALVSCGDIHMMYHAESGNSERELPQAYPNDGIYATSEATLYYRLRGTDYLYGVAITLAIPANTTPIEALLQELIFSAPVSDSGGLLEQTFPRSYSDVISNIHMSDNGVFVTLSDEILFDELYQFALLSIINTITTYDDSLIVAFLVDQKDERDMAYANVNGCPLLAKHVITYDNGGSGDTKVFVHIPEIIAASTTFAQTAANYVTSGNAANAACFFAHTNGEPTTKEDMERLMLIRPDSASNPLINVTFSSLSEMNNYIYMYLEVSDTMGSKVKLIAIVNFITVQGMRKVDYDKLVSSLYNTYKEGGVMHAPTS